MSLRIILTALPLLVVACTKPDALYCDESTPCTDPERPFCDLSGALAASDGIARTCIAAPSSEEFPDAGVPDEPDAMVMCRESSQCSGTLPICEDDVCVACEAGSAGDASCADRDAELAVCAPDGSCVACVTNDDCASGEPICDTAAGTCGVCSEHLECDSGACDFDSGACVDDGDIIYVDSGSGSDGSSCGAAPGAAACRNITGSGGALAKVSPSRAYMALASGAYTESVVLNGTNVTIIGSASTSLVQPGFVPGSPLVVQSGADVTISNITIRDGNGIGSGHGIRCSGSEIRLEGVTVRANDDAGITSDNCDLRLFSSQSRENSQEGIQLRAGSSLTMRDSAVVENDFHGLHIQSSAVDIRTSEIMDNATGGIYLFSSTFVIENNWIAGNGNIAFSPGNPTGGVVVETVPGPQISPQNIRHNTIVHNIAPGAVASAGIVCNTGTGTGTVECDSNIIVGNERFGIDVQTSGSCGIRFSMVTDISSSNGNLNATPVFLNQGAGDYHLQAGSPGIDVADPASPVSVDIDGDSRPSGAGFDMGADER